LESAARLVDSLSDINAAARLVFRLRRYDHVSDALAILQWLPLPERVNFTGAYGISSVETVWRHRICIDSFRYLACQVVVVCGRRSRCSCTSRCTVCQIAGVARFLSHVAASIFWNTLPDEMQSAPSFSSFRRQLKTFLFHRAFPDILV